MSRAEEDLKVWPAGALPSSRIAIVKPDFSGPDGFRMLKETLYAKGELKVTYVVVVCQGGTRGCVCTVWVSVDPSVHRCAWSAGWRHHRYL
jgi:hypothetical protein